MHSFRLRKPSGTQPIGPRIHGFRFSLGRHVCGSSNPIAEKPVSTGSDPPPPRGHRLALESVSFVVDTIRA